MPPRATQEVTREQLEGLRNKFELLQGDRKAYFETYETQKRQNDDLLKTEREKNKQLRRDLASLHKAAAAGENGSTQEAEKLQRELAQQRKAHDQLRAQARKRKKEKDALAAQLRDLELEGKKPTEDDSPQMRKIRNLENRLDKAMIKYNEAQSIRKTYEQIVKRLKEEKVGFDNQLKALQRTLEAKRQDLEELRMLAGDANHAKEVAIRELERVRAFAQEEKNRLSQQIREKENAAKKKFQLDELTRERARMRQDIVQEVEGDLGLEEEEQLKQTLEQNKRWKEVVAEETDEQRRKIGMYEDAFRRIKEATGVSDVNEVIQKVLSQDQQQQSLEQLTKTNATRIEALNKDLAALKERVDELKFSGGGGGRTAARRMVDSFEEKLAASQQRLDRAKEKYDRVAKILINAQAGVHHLTQKLASVRGEDEGELLGVTEDDSIVDVLCHCEASMQTIYGKVKQFEEEVRATRKRQHADEDFSSDEEDGPVGSLLLSLVNGPEPVSGGLGATAPATMASGASLPTLGITEDAIAATRVHNTRIDLPADDGELPGGGGGGGGESDDEHEITEETFGRDACKRAARERVNQHKKQQRKQRDTRRRP